MNKNIKAFLVTLFIFVATVGLIYLVVTYPKLIVIVSFLLAVFTIGFLFYITFLIVKEELK